MSYVFRKEGQNWLILVLMVLIRSLTTVNSSKRPPDFHSRHKPKPYPLVSSLGVVNKQKQPGVGQSVNLNKYLC